MKVFTTLGDGIENLKLIDLPIPEPSEYEILVKMKAVSINFRDLLVVNGVSSWKPASPRIPCSDGVGEVVAAGEKVNRVKIGDKVAGIFLPKWLEKMRKQTKSLCFRRRYGSFDGQRAYVERQRRRNRG